LGIEKIARLGDKLSARIGFFETVPNSRLINDKSLVKKWMNLSNAVTQFRRISVRQRGQNMIAVLRYNDENPVVPRHEQTIHRIMLSPLMINLVCIDEEMVRVTEGKCQLALYYQQFEKALPSIADELARTIRRNKTAQQRAAFFLPRLKITKYRGQNRLKLR